MRARRFPSLLLAAAALAALVVAVPAEAGKGGAKKQRKGGGTITRTFTTTALNQAIPDDSPVPGVEGALHAPITVAGKKLKGRVIDDVTVSVRASHPAIFDLTVRLVAPNGATTFVVNFPSGTSLGAGAADCTGTFLTLDDETPLALGFNTVAEPGELPPPYAGRARPALKPLAVMDGGPVRGTWQLVIRDFDTPNVGVLHCWQIEVRMRARSR
ncbi:MAG: proprotein convertase P-domain-containing protein [Solirubrobacterales bacterium]